MKLVTITGPRGAGKDSVIREVIKRFERKHPNKVKRALFLTTKAEADGAVHGIDVLLASEQEFRDLMENGDLADSVKVPDNLVGTSLDELQKWDNLLVSITLEGAKLLKKKFSKNKGKIFMIALSGDDKKDFNEFDLVVQSTAGEPEKTVNAIMAAAEKFFNS